MNSANIIEKEMTFSAHTYHSLPVVISKGKGVWLWDVEGKKYLDCISAYSAISFGHGHPRLKKALINQLDKVAVLSRAVFSDQLAPMLEKACALSGFEMGIPLNSGVEAVEAAIKVARRWGYEVKGIPVDQAEIIVADNNFHGRTISLISASTEVDYRRDFGPLTPGFKNIPFGDAKALEHAITPNTCAFLVEPIQGEAGIIVPPDGWLKDIRRICTKHNVLLILDEVQSGLGRSGKMFAFQHEDIMPDGLILGKALGGGILPVSMFLSNREVLSVMGPGSHGSTFGGNPLAAAVAYEALSILEEERLDERSAELGAYLIKRLRALKSPLIKEVRGKGLWIGVEFQHDHIAAWDVCLKMVERGVLMKDTHERIVRFAPPLVITKDELDFGIEAFESVVAELDKERS